MRSSNTPGSLIESPAASWSPPCIMTDTVAGHTSLSHRDIACAARVSRLKSRVEKTRQCGPSRHLAEVNLPNAVGASLGKQKSHLANLRTSTASMVAVALITLVVAGLLAGASCRWSDQEPSRLVGWLADGSFRIRSGCSVHDPAKLRREGLRPHVLCVPEQ